MLDIQYKGFIGYPKVGSVSVEFGYPQPNRRAAVTDLGFGYHRLTLAFTYLYVRDCGKLEIT
jgi:hypothetical protein